MRYTLILFFAIISIASAQKDSTTTFHLNAGLGYGTSGAAVLFGANFGYKDRFIQFRRLYTAELPDSSRPTGRIGDFALMFGYKRPAKPKGSQVNAAVGIGYVTGLIYPRHSGRELSTYGLAFQTTYLISSPDFGISSSVQGNFNLDQIFGAIVISLHIGKIQ
ncbi:MAG: hypothetical protein V4642_11420 [Bacteroidota bacterium]